MDCSVLGGEGEVLRGSNLTLQCRLFKMFVLGFVFAVMCLVDWVGVDVGVMG